MGGVTPSEPLLSLSGDHVSLLSVTCYVTCFRHFRSQQPPTPEGSDDKEKSRVKKAVMFLTDKASAHAPVAMATTRWRWRRQKGRRMGATP